MCIIYLRLFHQYVIVHVDLFVVPADNTVGLYVC